MPTHPDRRRSGVGSASPTPRYARGWLAWRHLHCTHCCSQAEQHLIASVGGATYLCLPKGGLQMNYRAKKYCLFVSPDDKHVLSNFFRHLWKTITTTITKTPNKRIKENVSNTHAADRTRPGPRFGSPRRARHPVCGRGQRRHCFRGTRLFPFLPLKTGATFAKCRFAPTNAACNAFIAHRKCHRR